jgi:hypothetical protein
MKFIFYHLFYRIYLWNIKVIKEKDFPVLSAYLFVTVMIGLNLMSLTSIYLVFIIKDPLALPSWEHWIFIIITVIPTYFIFLHKKKFKSILNDCENLSRIEKSKRDIVIFVYLLATLLFLIFISNASQDLLFRQGRLIR